jgi:hypothetical protein
MARNTTSVRPFIMSRTSREVLCRATESLPRGVIGLERDYVFLKVFLLFRDEARLVKAGRAWYRLSKNRLWSAIHRYAVTRRLRPITGGASSTRAKPALFKMLSSSATV